MKWELYLQTLRLCIISKIVLILSFIKAKEKMAEIYLHHRKDKRMYAQCYRQIVEKTPTAQTYILLGDAYMAIQGI